MAGSSLAIGGARAAPTAGARVSDFLALLKPRVVALVVLTTLVGMALAPGALHPVLAFTAVLWVAVGAINM